MPKILTSLLLLLFLALSPLFFHNPHKIRLHLGHPTIMGSPSRYLAAQFMFTLVDFKMTTFIMGVTFNK